MISSQNLRTITDMRRDADEILRLAARRKEPIGILKNNKLQGYFVDAKTLETIEALVEDYLDTQLVSKRLKPTRQSDSKNFLSFWKKHQLPR